VFSDAALNSYIAIILNQIAGAEMLSVPVLSRLSSPAERVLRNTSSVDDVARTFSTTTGVVHLVTDTGHSAAAADQLEPQTTYVVGPLIYMYFSTVNASDAGFSVDLLFRHPDYLKASFFLLYRVLP